jgi:hypothetical protein
MQNRKDEPMPEQTPGSLPLPPLAKTLITMVAGLLLAAAGWYLGTQNQQQSSPQPDQSAEIVDLVYRADWAEKRQEDTFEILQSIQSQLPQSVIEPNEPERNHVEASIDKVFADAEQAAERVGRIRGKVLEHYGGDPDITAAPAPPPDCCPGPCPQLDELQSRVDTLWDWAPGIAPAIDNNTNRSANNTGRIDSLSRAMSDKADRPGTPQSRYETPPQHRAPMSRYQSSSLAPQCPPGCTPGAPGGDRIAGAEEAARMTNPRNTPGRR